MPRDKKCRPKTKELLATKASLETEVPILREIVASEEVRSEITSNNFDVIFLMRALLPKVGSWCCS